MSRQCTCYGETVCPACRDWRRARGIRQRQKRVAGVTLPKAPSLYDSHRALILREYQAGTPMVDIGARIGGTCGGVYKYLKRTGAWQPRRADKRRMA